jgi:HrpA-like RNA helicase
MSSADFARPKFAKPNLDYASSLAEERLNSAELELEVAKFSQFTNVAVETQRKQLPIYKSYKQILYALETNRVVVVVGETG